MDPTAPGAGAAGSPSLSVTLRTLRPSDGSV